MKIEDLIFPERCDTVLGASPAEIREIYHERASKARRQQWRSSRLSSRKGEASATDKTHQQTPVTQE